MEKDARSHHSRPADSGATVNHDVLASFHAIEKHSGEIGEPANGIGQIAIRDGIGGEAHAMLMALRSLVG